MLGPLEVLHLPEPEEEMYPTLHFSRVLPEHRLEEMSLTIGQIHQREELFPILIIQEFQPEISVHLKMTIITPVPEKAVVEM